ncbi:hypothetical protein TNCV_879001 [Trichonephila clavipes]|nr:hypothetical protein TNCV_879001 [Trichonephila clavipes]
MLLQKIYTEKSIATYNFDNFLKRRTLSKANPQLQAHSTDTPRKGKHMFNKYLNAYNAIIMFVTCPPPSGSASHLNGPFSFRNVLACTRTRPSFVPSSR